MILYLLLSQALPSPTINSMLDGNAGWVGTTLLSGVLSWLLFVHLPAKDKQLERLMESHSKERVADQDARHASANVMQEVVNRIYSSHAQEKNEQLTIFREELKDARVDYKESLAQVIQHCVDENDKLLQRSGESNKLLEQLCLRLETLEKRRFPRPNSGKGPNRPDEMRGDV